MDSRLPKPSGLKRPAASAFRNLVPSDRLTNQPHIGSAASTTAAVTSHIAATSQFGATASRTTAVGPPAKMPLTASDFLNLPAANIGGVPHKRRHASPEAAHRHGGVGGPPVVVRAKMRRSRSASELLRPNRANAGASNARFAAGGGGYGAASLDSMPPKLTKSATSLRLLPNSTAVPAASFKSRLAPITRRPLTTTTTTRPTAMAAAANRRGVTTAKPAAPTKSTAATTSTAAAAASSAAGGGPTKKFAPYDYKGRFLDLQERHKALREKLEQNQEQIAEYASLGEQFEESQASLFRCQDQLKNEASQTQCLRQQLSTQEIKLECLTVSMTEKLAEIKRLRSECDRLTADNARMEPELVELRRRTGELDAQVAGLTVDLAETQESLFRSNMERKELHNVVMDLRGNIRVFCRVRPPLAGEMQRPLCGWQYLDESSLEISTLDGGAKKPIQHSFSFDQVFHPRSAQADIFELVSPLIQSALDGFNVCIFAYGQTGSGKTFTMDGVQEDIGIIPRTVDLLFDCTRNYRRLGWEYTIKVTFLEIYNEVLYDLLSNEAKDMDIRMVSARTPTEIYVSNITEVTVETANELRELMDLAKSNRATASTAGNERSSRSHAVTRIQLIGQHAGKNETCVGTINLVDLAGSESPKTSTRMEETKKINKSLSELTNVIMALMQRHEHIPYRNSKLTHLLMPCLGGNSKTLMFINVAPFQDCFVESVKSLRFAASVNSCKMAKAKRNKYLNTSGDQPRLVSSGSTASLT